MSRIKLVVFDIAGTIIEDRGEVVRAFAKALMDNGIPFGGDELKQWKGATKREVIRHFVNKIEPRERVDQLVETTYRRFLLELEGCYKERVTAIAGAVETFQWCRDRNIPLVTTTGFDHEINNLVLDQTGWRQYFAANVSSSDVRQGRPAPFMIFRAMEATGVQNVKEVINVGDTPLDLRSGSKAGLGGVIGVLTGAHNRDDLQREPHTHIIDSVAELPNLIMSSF